MVQLVIRDDDMNFFTKVEDIEFVYKDFGDFPISFAVIPHVLDVSTIGACPDTKGNITPKDVADNIKLVEWIKERLKDKTCDVLLHGINHNYKYFGNVRKAEMQWRDSQFDLCSQIKHEKERLSVLFDYKISCFVAPSNKITKYCLKQVTDADLDFSGIVPIKPNVDFTVGNLFNYLRRWWVRLFYKIPYPGVLKYNNHKEVNACLLQSYDYLVSMYNYCEKHNLPMAINVHYWHLRDNPVELEMLRKFVMEYALPKGAVPTRESDLFK